MKKLLVATHNPAKLKELSEGLEPLTKKGFEILSLHDLNVTEDPEETGTTFLENAQLKAEYYGKKTGLPTLSDDGGLMIDILNGEPGVISKRWAGHAASDQELIKFTLKKLQGIPDEKRTAKFHTCLYFFDPKTHQTFYEENGIKGTIAKEPAKEALRGFPYRALFIVSTFNKYYDQLTHEEHEQVNHRLKALKRISEKIEKYLLE